MPVSVSALVSVSVSVSVFLSVRLSVCVCVCVCVCVFMSVCAFGRVFVCVSAPAFMLASWFGHFKAPRSELSCDCSS